ncbi:MAG: L-idonate 5-dehydrogenase [Kiloniellales bacterium]
MKALVVHAAQDLRIEEHEEVTPGPSEVLLHTAVGGICGSDLHYFNHGGFGPVRLREPMILGHEVSGHVAALGDGVTGLTVGDLVSVSPSRPCGSCRFCDEGLQNHCLDMRFYGSAMPFPHIQGAFSQSLTVAASQCVPANGLSAGEAAMAEPFSVALHATRRAGDLLGKRVLVTGCGPIGALAIVAARRAGAAEIVVTDLSANALDFARKAGADLCLDVGQTPDALTAYGADKGTFDVLYECSGSAAALSAAIAAIRPRGIILQLGLGGDMTLPMMQITAKELELRGSFRFHEEFALAVDLMRKGLVSLAPLISHCLPMEQALEAFRIAGDRSRAMKTQIRFGGTA